MELHPNTCSCSEGHGSSSPAPPFRFKESLQLQCPSVVCERGWGVSLQPLAPVCNTWVRWGRSWESADWTAHCWSSDNVSCAAGVSVGQTRSVECVKNLKSDNDDVSHNRDATTCHFAESVTLANSIFGLTVPLAAPRNLTFDLSEQQLCLNWEQLQKEELQGELLAYKLQWILGGEAQVTVIPWWLYLNHKTGLSQ